MELEDKGTEYRKRKITGLSFSLDILFNIYLLYICLFNLFIYLIFIYLLFVYSDYQSGRYSTTSYRHTELAAQ